MKPETKVKVLDCLLYTSIMTAIELSKEWALIGAQGLRQYDIYDWLILVVGVWAVAGVAIHAYFTNRFTKNGSGGGKPPESGPTKI